MKPGTIRGPKVSPSKERPLWGSCLVGALAAIVILAWMLAAHLEYVEMSTKQVFCWDFAAGEKWIEVECMKALAYDH